MAEIDRLERLQRTRAKEVERAERDPRQVVCPMSTSVVGVSFTPTYPRNLHSLREMTENQHFWDLDEPLPAILIRNPANAHDSNAIEVHIPALGAEAFIGHIPKALAARMAPEMDEGGEFVAAITRVRIHPDHEDRPGIDVSIDRVVRDDA